MKTAAPLRVRFHPAGSGFHAAVKSKVDAYFDDNGLSRHANAAMVGKTIFWLGATASFYALVMSGLLPPLGDLLAVMALGFCLACIGFNVGHDAIHGAYAARPWVNTLMSWTFQAKGAASYTWAISHNVTHHTYTNMPGHDGDIEPGDFMRFHTAHPAKPIHRYQHFYAWFLYCFTSLVWVYTKDFQQVMRKNPRTGKRPPPSAVASVIASKVFHAGLLMVPPILFLDYAPWQLALGYLAMHAVGGFTLAVVFQLAHVVEGPVAPSAGLNGSMQDSWAEHQMRTTANFARGSFLSQFVCGGLNHQVEHHLFPRICHVHYPALAPLVLETAKEFGLPYHEQPSFLAAVRSHARQLRWLGTAPQRRDEHDDVDLPIATATASAA
jgi:linoleoyl-CoA desaturase